MTGCYDGSIKIWKIETDFKLGKVCTENTHRWGPGGSVTVRLVSSFTSLDLAASLGRYKNMIFSSLVKSSLVKLETSYTVVLPPTVSGLWFGYQSVQWI